MKPIRNSEVSGNILLQEWLRLSTLTISCFNDKLNYLINYYWLKWKWRSNYKISNIDTFISPTVHNYNSIQFGVVYIKVTVWHNDIHTWDSRRTIFIIYASYASPLWLVYLVYYSIKSSLMMQINSVLWFYKQYNYGILNKTTRCFMP